MSLDTFIKKIDEITDFDWKTISPEPLAALYHVSYSIAGGKDIPLISSIDFGVFDDVFSVIIGKKYYKLNNFYIEDDEGLTEKTSLSIPSTDKNLYPVIDNQYILLPDFLNEGDKLIIKVVDNDDVPLMSVTREGKENTTWGAFKASYKIEKGSKLYVNKVPMIAYKVIDGKEIPAFYIHDVTWYNRSNISIRNGCLDQEQAIEEGIANVIRIRNSVIEGNDKIIITRRDFGGLSKTNLMNVSISCSHRQIINQIELGCFSTMDDIELKTINEATGDSQIAIFWKGSLYNDFQNGSKPLELEFINDIANGVFKNKEIVDIRQVGINQKTGKPIFVALPVFNSEDILESTFNSYINRTDKEDVGLQLNINQYDLKSILKTNILSYRIEGFDGKQQWVTDVRPMIYYDLVDETTSNQLTSEEKETILDQNSMRMPSQEVLDRLTPELQELYIRTLEENSENLCKTKN